MLSRDRSLKRSPAARAERTPGRRRHSIRRACKCAILSSLPLWPNSVYRAAVRAHTRACDSTGTTNTAVRRRPQPTAATLRDSLRGSRIPRAHMGPTGLPTDRWIVQPQPAAATLRGSLGARGFHGPSDRSVDRPTGMGRST